MHRPTVSVVVPAYNEEGNVAEIHRRVAEELAGCVDSFELLFVDDGSTDGTADAVTDLHRTDPRVGLVRLSRNFGHQSALMAGLDQARGRAVVAMDADLQHPPALLPELISRWRAGAEVVQTVRDDAGSVGLFKRLTSRLFYALMRRMTALPIVTGTADFFLLDRRAVDAVNQCRENARFTRGLVPWVGFRRDLTPYQADRRHAGASKYSLVKMVRLAMDGIFGFSVAPLKLVGSVGMIAVLLSLVYLLYATYARLFGDGVERGWTSLMAVVIFMGGLQLVTLWVIGQYVARIAEQTRNRPPYLVAETIAPEPGEAQAAAPEDARSTGDGTAGPPAMI